MSLDGRMYQWMSRIFSPAVQWQHHSGLPFTCRHTELRLVLFTLQTWVQLLPEDMCESCEMEMDSVEAQTLPMNGHILSTRARAVAGIFCCVSAVLQLWVWTESLPDLLSLFLTCADGYQTTKMWLTTEASFVFIFSMEPIGRNRKNIFKYLRNLLK